jgi:hypothetical protein
MPYIYNMRHREYTLLGVIIFVVATLLAILFITKLEQPHKTTIILRQAGFSCRGDSISISKSDSNQIELYKSSELRCVARGSYMVEYQ